MHIYALVLHGGFGAQATSYLVTAWEALASQHNRRTSDLPVVFENVRILQAVPAAADTPVKLSVSLDARHRFQVNLSWNQRMLE